MVSDRVKGMIEELHEVKWHRASEPAATFAQWDADRAAGRELDARPVAADRRDGETVSPGPHKPTIAGFDSQPCYQNDPYALWQDTGGEA